MTTTIRYPRRRVIRAILKTGIAAAFGILADFEIEGRENVPTKGPLLVVANHFHFLDPLALIHIAPWPIEFVGGAQTPNAPSTVGWLSKAFGVIPTYRGTGAKHSKTLKRFSNKKECWRSSLKAVVGLKCFAQPDPARPF